MKDFWVTNKIYLGQQDSFSEKAEWAYALSKSTIVRAGPREL